MAAAHDDLPHPLQHSGSGIAPAAPSPCPEFDWQGAIERLGGQAATYTALSRRFLESSDAVLDRLYPLLRQSSATASEEAAQLLHSLRGSALTLGATELARRVRVTEALLTTAEPCNREDLLAQLRATIEQTLATLRKIVDCLDADAPPCSASRLSSSIAT